MRVGRFWSSPQEVAIFAYVLVPWMKHVARRPDLAPSTKANYLRVARVLIASAIPVQDHVIDRHAHVQARRAAGCSTRTVMLEIRVASIARGWAVRGGMLPSTTELRVPRLRVDQDDWHVNHATPTPEQAAAAISALTFDDWRLAIALIARTGARAGEVVALIGSDLDEDAGTIAFGKHEGARKTRGSPRSPHRACGAWSSGGCCTRRSTRGSRRRSRATRSR
jgi:integrase